MNAIKNFLEGLQPKPEGSSNAIDILKEDHSRVKEMLEKFLQLEESEEKAPLLKSIIEELSVHSSAEEELVYPKLMDEDKDLTLESYEEHHVVKMLLEELADMDAGDDKTKAKVKVLSELVKKHIEEEEHQFFPELKDTDTDLEQLGQELMQRKEELKSSMAKGVGKKRVSRHKAKSKTAAARTKTTKARGRAKTASSAKTKGKTSSRTKRKPASTSRRSTKSKTSSASKRKTAASARKSKSAATAARSKSAESTNRKRSTRSRRRMPTRKAS